MKKKLVGLGVFLSVALFLPLVVSYFMPKRLPQGAIETTGIIEATEMNLSSKITERIKEIKYIEGGYIKQGDVAVLLDDEKRRAEYDQAAANVEVSEANLLISAADIEKAKVKLFDSKRDLERNSRLLDKKLVAQNDKDKAQTNYDIAISELDKAIAQEALAKATLKQAEAAYRLAGANLEDTVIKSALSGVVTLKAFEQGEMVTAGAAILTIVDLTDMWVRVDVEETMVARIKLGGLATVKVDGLPRQKFKGRVFEINSEGEFATQRDVRRGRQDIKTFRVKVQLEEPKGILKEGMTATVMFTP